MSEFEKRINRDKFFVREQNSTFRAHVIKPETVLRIIAKAKEEFPFWIPRTKARAIYLNKKGEQLPIENIEEIADKLYEWLEKWFGS